MLEKRRAVATNRLQRVLQRKTFRKRIFRAGLVVANVIVLGVVGLFVVSSAPGEKNALPALQLQNEAVALSPVDTFTASDVAVSVAKATRLNEATAVANQAQSARAAVLMSASSTSIAAKPQIMETPLKSWRDIKEYLVMDGDSVSKLAQKFGITSDSIKWSNKLTGDTLTVGSTIVLPPANGIVHTVVAGDTPQSLATKYRADATRIAADNDAEVEALVVGRRVFVANGSILVSNAAASAARRVPISNFRPIYGYNGYDPGWCTYYAAYRSGAPANWGNANTWAYYAARSGWRVSSTPTVGAIFQTSAGRWGHVGIVEAVSEDGTMMKYSDMNGLAGFWRVGYSDWVPSTKYPNYITRE